MKRTRLTAAVTALLIMIMSFAACAASDTPAENSDIYRFEDYQSSDLFDIESVELSSEYAQKCNTYRFTYMCDGFRIKAYISIPLSAVKSQKPYKCIMLNHGGNRNTGILEDDTTAMVCSACDRVVVGSQYRGCGGSEGEDHFGGDDLNDVIRLIDLCDSRFAFIDMDDFCVIGASRGGVMTYPAARKDKRIKRIIALSAVSDLVEAYNSREDMKRVLKDTIGCTPQEDPAEYEKRSAIYWADEITIPVLMFHSKMDAQVSYQQAEQLYEKLKQVTDCTLISYDDDLHSTLHPGDAQIINDWLNK